ncbi:hypothetical protein ZHAS_00022328 [Anopheles sinensis]|uniref:Uncharacterized protein n=1 Tax=Anopheles sinensis TaxID=74873 RepID=A0A084WUI9_ANOSI|nr:hypothetical protein ZHAS_00022328 [Anopheles sinensis]
MRAVRFAGHRSHAMIGLIGYKASQYRTTKLWCVARFPTEPQTGTEKPNRLSKGNELAAFDNCVLSAWGFFAAGSWGVRAEGATQNTSRKRKLTSNVRDGRRGSKEEHGFEIFQIITSKPPVEPQATYVGEPFDGCSCFFPSPPYLT